MKVVKVVKFVKFVKWRRALAAAVAVAAGLLIVLAWSRVAPAAALRIPTAHVQRGRVQVMVYTSGELRAGRSSQLIAPPIGGNLQIVKLAASGEPVKVDDIVVEFDTAEQVFNLEQARFDLGDLFLCYRLGCPRRWLFPRRAVSPCRGDPVE